MKKPKTIVVAVTLVISSASAMAMAQDGQFFINGNLGQSNFSNSLTGGWDKTDTQGALRLGYAWHGVWDYGIEAGYADLGQASQRGSYSYTDLNGKTQQAAYQGSFSARGWLLGGNLKYNFNPSWYLSARGGWFQPRTTSKYSSSGIALRQSQNITQDYFGLGAGYNVSRSWSLGIGYDYYDLGRDFGHVNAYSATAEFRF
ncbi:outer membrane protein [Dyella soli]|uniref:Porin family protein n=1 Tax=Dyella soli TaxID=522319 RepID=A0A4R0YZA8_9GAMM|nr:outer membrane beta-barrel protein [Dyella soli]TCI10914.1 porin family protein [Dyella soli]